MSDSTFDATPPEENIPDELTALKERADMLNIKYSPNIGLETLRERVNTKIKEGKDPGDAPTGDTQKEAVSDPTAKKVPTKSAKQIEQEYHTELRRQAQKLVRVVVTCMNPNKRDWAGEIITTGNAVVGTIKKYVPFGIEAGYHIPHMIYEQLKQRRYQHFEKKKLPGGKEQMVSKMSPEFNIKVLDPLTPHELEELKTRQALNRSIDD